MKQTCNTPLTIRKLTSHEGKGELLIARIRPDDPRYSLNRHESWLAFNRRVLEEALDESNPLLDRVKFLAITAADQATQTRALLSG